MALAECSPATVARPDPRPPPPAPVLSRQMWPTDPEIRGARRSLHAKAVVIAALVVTSYCGLVFASIGLGPRIACALVLVVGVVATGTSIMHDANHGAFSRSPGVNRVFAYSADLVGASSWVWRLKHNTLHHVHPNVVGVDTDIDQAPFARLAPQQAWRPWHRYQHLYAWGLYGFLTVKWFLVSDIAALARGGIDDTPFPEPRRRRDVSSLVGGKLVHLAWAGLIPLLFHPWWGVLAFYLGCSWLVGFILAMFFQLAHCTAEVDFLEPSVATEPFDRRQLRTTADIRPRGVVVGPFVRWLMGGLDHQIEHHLAPRLPHTLYAQLAARVEVSCAERGVAYHAHPTLWSAIRAHGRWLKAMGEQPA